MIYRVLVTNTQVRLWQAPDDMGWTLRQAKWIAKEYLKEKNFRSTNKVFEKLRRTTSKQLKDTSARRKYIIKI